MYRRRWLEGVLSGGVSRNKVRLLFGARQAGKTALLGHLLPRDGTRFFNLQETDLRRRFEVDPGSFRREVRSLPRSVENVVVDEIQKVPALLDEVQALHDDAPRGRQFFLTGSSARQLRRQSANLLPGRAHEWRLHPVTSWECAGPAEPLVVPPPRRTGRAQPSPGDSIFPEQDLGRVLRFGRLPGVLGESPRTAEKTLSTYVDAYLEEEIRREALVRDMGGFLVFLRLAAAESGRQTNIAKLSQESGVPASTLKSHQQVLVDTFVAHWVPAYARRARTRLLVTPRFYFFDVGVRNAAAEVPFDARILPALGGPLLEGWVAQELLARASYLGRGHRVSFWRTTTGVEVDFVWESPRRDIPIEVKWTDRPRPTDARHVERFLDSFPERANQGYVVCRCPARQQLTDRVTAIPWDQL